MLLENREFLTGDFATNFIEKSGILKRILPQPPVKRTYRRYEMEEKEIADIVFRIYQSLKQTKKISAEKDSPSNWVMSERLKMFE